CLTGGVHGTVDVLLIAGTDPAEVLRGEGNLDLDRLLGLGAIGGQLVGGQPAQRLLEVCRECAEGQSLGESQSSHGWKYTFVEEPMRWRSEEHTSELQSRFDLVCRLLREKNK